MNNDEIKQWCYEIWPKHWRDLAPSSNSRALFVKEMVKLPLDNDEIERIGGAILEQTRFWRLKSKREKVYGIPRLSQWIKDCRYDDLFIDESFVDIKQSLEGAKCTKCDNPTHGTKYNQCHKHLLLTDRFFKQKCEAMKKHDLIPSKHLSKSEYAAKCRKTLSREWITKLSGMLSVATKEVL